MDIFNSNTPSFVPETELLGIGQIEKENLGLAGVSLAGAMALELPEETTPYYIEEGQADWLLNGQNEGTENGHLLLGGSGYLDTDSGGDLLTGQTEEMPQKEGEDLLTAGGLAIDKMVAEAVPKVRDLLQGFAQKPEFEVEMGLAFGNSEAGEKAEVLKAALSGEDLEILPEIEIVDGDLINGANGAFAGETETIYLAREFVWENLGDVGQIIPVIVEEFGHYLDWEFNSFDAPGDEGEIFASFVLGEELSLPEFLGMKVEDDGAIGFLDGRMVSIERQATEPNSDECGSKKTSVYVFYINGVRVSEENYNTRDWPSVENLVNQSLEEQEDELELFFEKTTYNRSGIDPESTLSQFINGLSQLQKLNFLKKLIPQTEIVFDSLENIQQLTEALQSAGGGDIFIQSIIQGISPLADPEGIAFANGIVERIKEIDEEQKNQAEQSCCDTPKSKFLIVSHSQGNFFAENAARDLPPEIQERTKILAISPFTNFGTSSYILPGSLGSQGIFTISDDAKSGSGPVEVNHLVREDDISNVLRFLPGIAAPEPNLVNEWPGTGLLNSLNLDLANSVESHDLQNYINVNVPGRTTLEQQAVQESVDEAIEKVQNLLEFDSDVYSERKEDCSPVSMSDVSVTEGNEGAPAEGSQAYFTFNGNYYEWEPRVVQPFTGPTGDILSRISLETLGSASPEAFNFIAFHNDISDPDLIIAGSTIEVPKEVPVPETDGFAVFDVSHSGDPNIPVKLTYETIDETANAGRDYQATSGELSIPSGQGGVVLVPIVGDERQEDTETFQLTLKKQDGTCFGECVSEVTATGTIVNDDEGDEGDTFNDPRLVTFDSKYYDFQAAGEFTLVESVSGDLNIQVRQEPVNGNPRSNVSDNTAVATLLDGQRVTLYKDTQQLLINGNPTVVPDNGFLPVGEGFIERDGNVYSIVYPTGDELVAKLLSSRINIKVLLPEAREGQVVGLLGNNNGNPDDDIAKRDGTVLTAPVALETLYGEFADSWRLTQEESLFEYNPGEDTNTFTISNFPRERVSIDDLNPADVRRAEELIGDRISDPTVREAAIIDLVLTDFDESVIEGAIASQTPGTSLSFVLQTEAVTDTAITAINTPNIIDVLANDISTEGVPLSLETFPETSAAGGTITRDDSGTPDDASDDLLAYAPPANFSGSDSFQYTINDGERTATGLVTIIVPGLNLANLDGNNGFVLDGINPGNFSGVAVSKIGDFNGDSIDDLSIGAFAADPNGNNAAGESYVIFGTNNGFPANLDLTNLDGSNGLTLQGIDIQGLSGGAVGGAGDINNDGIDDLIIGAFGAPANGNNNAGKAYVVFGNSGLPANIDLANLNGSSGFVLSGLNEFDYAGVAVGGAGDINNDGIDDLYISAPGPLSSPPSKTYIVFGSETDYPANIDLSALNGSTGFVINDSRGLAGSDVSKAGDINNDGIADLIIGADEGSGDSYVVYGSSSFPATVELSSILNGTNGSQLAATDVLNPDGTTVRGVGDVNNDGIDDLMVAVSGTTPVDNLPITKGYVVFGDRSLPFRFDLSALNGSNGFVINDFSIDNILGFSIGEVGDFNRDGIDDILIGTSQADANGNIDSGKSYVVFGKRDGNFPTNIDLARLDSRDGLVLNGVESEDLTGSAVDGAGDLNNDGISDLIVGAPGSLFNDAPGKSYVVFGSGNFGSSTTLVFDEVYYLSQNPEVANLVATGAVGSGLEHFTRFGVGEERDFRVLLFNENSYLTQNPEVASLVASGELGSGLEHFTRFGQFEERSAGASEQSSIPLRFDENYYLNQNPEVREAVEAGLFSSGFDHYIQVGQFQDRLTSA